MNNKEGTSSAEELWIMFRSGLEKSMRAHIPVKTLSSRWNIPWITAGIKRRIRQKQRYYNKARKTKKDADWKKFRDLRRNIKNEIKIKHDKYVLN